MNLAARIIAERPTFCLFENNCQNFVKFLLNALCPGVPIRDTIQDILQRLQDIPRVANAVNDALPGTYPASRSSGMSTSFKTASETTWVTASGDTWVIAIEFRPSSGSNYSQSLAGILPLNHNQRPTIFKIAQRKLRGKTAIIRAVKDGDMDQVAILLRIQADLSVERLGKCRYI